MKVNVIGIRKVNFVDNASGAPINGHTIYCTHVADGVLGLEGKKFFIKSALDISKVELGSDVELFFNERGKVDSLQVIK